jgi:hypothetical protein
MLSFLFFLNGSAFAQKSNSFKHYRVSKDTCKLYEWKNKQWLSVDSHLIPIGTEIETQPATQRSDVVYVKWQGRVFSAYKHCLTEVVSAAVASAHPQDDEAIDLGDPSAIGEAMDSSISASAPGANRTDTPPNAPSSKDPAHRGDQGVAPSFHVYFDFDLVDQPGAQPLSFDNYHSFLFFEILPTPEISFTFDVEAQPKYYELDYQVTPKLQVRFGKIWIPFDDLSPHNIYGGRTNISRISPGPAFLPDIWTEMGVGVKYQFVDTKNLNLVGNLYVTNGFGDANGKDPLGNNPDYPDFSDSQVTTIDNNSEKAIGGRMHALIGNRLGLGVSYYHDRWNPDGGQAENVDMYGSDFSYQFGKGFELRAGFIVMKVTMITGDFDRGGYYTELGKRFGKQDAWKILIREGQVQEDDRVIQKSDQKIIGATLLYQPNVLEYSIEYSQDIEKNDLKSNYNYFAARVVMAF